MANLRVCLLRKIERGREEIDGGKQILLFFCNLGKGFFFTSKSKKTWILFFFSPCEMCIEVRSFIKETLYLYWQQLNPFCIYLDSLGFILPLYLESAFILKWFFL